MPEDVHSLFHDVLRHRVVLSYEALAADVRPDQVLDAIIDAIPQPDVELGSGRASADRTPEALLRRVELRVARRLDGLLQGERQGRRPGPGGEPALTRAYEDGDDVRWVDWPLSARLGEPMVRVPEIEPVLTAWALVDLLALDGVRHRRPDQARPGARGARRASASCMRRRGDRLGVVATRGRRHRPGAPAARRPPRPDRGAGRRRSRRARGGGRRAHRPRPRDHGDSAASPATAAPSW